ncbi:MAG: histone deacetylase [bacterium]
MGSQLICDRVFEEHRTGKRHPESPDRITAIHRGYESVEDPPWTWVDPERKATLDELTFFHTESYINEVEDACESGRSLDADTPVSERSYELARLAAGSSLYLAEEGAEANEAGFGAVRPPGHHAERKRGMGFCLFNNIVLAAEAITRRNETVAIVDVDVHHGNGTQNAFYDRSDVLYVSLHQYPFYPGTGAADETGTGDGEGYTLNIPMDAGSGWNEYEPEWTGRIAERIDAFNPDHLMVSAGFDAHDSDPIGGLSLTNVDYLEIASDLRQWSKKYCNGRLLGLLEGGYNLETLEQLVPKFTKVLLKQ